MTSDYNDSRVKTKTRVWDKDEIDIYNDYYSDDYYSKNINNRVYKCKRVVDKYNNVNNYNIECNSNGRVKEDREYEYWMFIDVSCSIEDDYKSNKFYSYNKKE